MAAKSNAQRQAEFRQRRIANTQNYTRLRDALVQALDAGRSSRFVKGLPEEPNAECEALVSLLLGKAVVLFPPRK